MRRVSVAIALTLAAAAAVWAQQSRSNPCDAGNGGLTLPTGFCASVVADNLGQARHMALSPSGDLYVMIMNSNDAAYRPTGLAQARDGSVYVADDVKGRIWKIAYVGNRQGTGE